MLKYINSGLFKMLVSFVNRDKTGRNIELKNKGSLITAIVEGFNEYWSLQEIQSAIEVVESRSELVQQYTNITKSSSDKVRFRMDKLILKKNQLTFLQSIAFSRDIFMKYHQVAVRVKRPYRSLSSSGILCGIPILVAF